MKKYICAALAAAALISALMCGCGTKNESGKEESKTEASASSADLSAASDTKSAESSAASSAASGVAQSELSPENFSEENGFIIYSRNGQPACETGIDVSSYNGDIDWARVKNAGISFVMVRLGGRGYGDEGSLYSDDKAAEYIAGAQAAGLKTGGYFFSQAISHEEAREEAEYCRQLVGDLKLDYPLAYDWEIIKDDEARTDNLTVEQATSCARAFCDAVKEYGWQPMIYASDAEISKKYDVNQLSDIELWYSEYDAAYPSFPYALSMWQYSKTAAVDGITGDADLNLRFTG